MSNKAIDSEYDFLNKEVEKINKNRLEGTVFELEIESLQIIINSNIPNSSLIYFTKDMLYSPLLQNVIPPDIAGQGTSRDSLGRYTKNQTNIESNSKVDFTKLSEYPYFTNVIRYPKSKLEALEYHELVKFFFDKNEFQTILMELMPSKTTTNSINHNNNEYNIMTTIELLFPMVDPYKNNFNTSINEYINQVNYSTSAFFPTKHYTFLRHNYKIYTATKIIWINDILNHPVYKSLIEDFYVFQKWAIMKDRELENEFTTNNKKIQDLLTSPNINYSTEIETLQNYKQRLLNKINGSSTSSTSSTSSDTAFFFSQRETSEDVINIFKIFNIYKDYIKKNNIDFYSNVKILLSRYKPRETELVEVKIDNYWYSAKIVEYNYENDRYDLEISNLIGQSAVQVILLKMSNISIDSIRKPLLISFLEKEENFGFNFESSTLKKKRATYENLRQFITHFWEYNHTTENSPDIDNTNQLNPNTTQAYSSRPNRQNTYNKITTYDYTQYHELIFVDKNDIMKRHYRISDKFVLTETKKSADEIINEQLEKLEYIFVKDTLRMQITAETKKILMDCIGFYKGLNSTKNFHRDYLHDMKVDVNAVIYTKFPEYLNFINKIKKYINPQMVSFNPKLQKIIDDYANNINSKTFINLMTLSIPCLSTATLCDVIKNPKFIDTIKTDINIFKKDDNNSKYTIFLHIDFVEGQLDRAAATDRGLLSKLNCMYNDALLTRQFNNLNNKRNTNTWIIQPAQFIQVENPGETPEEKLQQPESQQPALQQPALQQPALQQPALQQPALQQPQYQPYGQPLPNQPGLEKPGMGQPATYGYAPNNNHFLVNKPNDYQQPAYAAGGYHKTLKKNKRTKRKTQYANR
jgi:hypothetical protein